MYSINNFSKNGIAFPLKLKNQFSDQELADSYINFQKKCAEKLGHSVSLKPNILSTFFDKLAFDENILNEVRKLIGDDIYIWSSAFFPKLPNEGKMVSFHQDKPYWQLSSSNVVSAWIALTKSKKNSGALSVVPESHKLGLIGKIDVTNARNSYLKGEKTTEKNDLLSYKQDLSKYLKKNKPICVELNPGEYSIHHVNLVHGSSINNSDEPRIGFVVRYISSETKHIIEKDGDGAIHVSGKKNNYFSDEERPSESFSKKSILSYERAMKTAGAFGNKKYVSEK
jgi:non-haem Fe2+, alpha-ketoglutarate-dependent halogenase